MWILWLYWIGMGVFTILFGFVPLYWANSKKNINILSLFGAGMLVGAAFIIMIPEATVTIFESYSSEVYQNGGISNQLIYIEKYQGINSEALETLGLVIGLSVTSGFLLMLFIDKFFIGEHHEYDIFNIFSDEEAELNNEDIMLEEIDRRNQSQEMHEDQKESLSLKQNSSLGGRSGNKYDTFSKDSSTNEEDLKKSVFVTFLGILIHSITDGISFGAVNFAGHSRDGRVFQMIIFIAMVWHKIPAAIGLTSFMISQKIKHRELIKYLITFAFSAPIAALITCYTLWEIKSRFSNTDGIMQMVGICLFISAGSFIYVALMHIVPEVFSRVNKRSKNRNNRHKISNIIQIILMAVGWCTPFVVHLLE